MNTQLESGLEIREVSGKQDLKVFIRVPWEIYKNDPAWIPPLIAERKEALSPKHPFFQHARWRAWIAYQDGKPVGRISAQIDQLHQDRYKNRTGFFGLIEALQHSEIFELLFATAENWLRQQGMQNIAGPFNLGINQEIGILVDGFTSPPYIMMGHSPPYYDAAIQKCGYQGAQELLAYNVESKSLIVPRVMQALIKKNAGRVKVRSLRRGDKQAELEVMRSIFNDTKTPRACHHP